MARLTDAILAFDQALTGHLAALGRSPSARRLAASARELRRAALRLALAERLAELRQAPPDDPEAAIDGILDLARGAGLDWRQLAAAVNRAGERGVG